MAKEIIHPKCQQCNVLEWFGVFDDDGNRLKDIAMCSASETRACINHSDVYVPAVEVAFDPKCDFCGGAAFVDGKSKDGPWGFFCHEHHRIHGIGFGTGVGQYMLRRV